MVVVVVVVVGGSTHYRPYLRVQFWLLTFDFDFDFDFDPDPELDNKKIPLKQEYYTL